MSRNCFLTITTDENIWHDWTELGALFCIVSRKEPFDTFYYLAVWLSALAVHRFASGASMLIINVATITTPPSQNQNDRFPLCEWHGLHGETSHHTSSLPSAPHSGLRLCISAPTLTPGWLLGPSRTSVGKSRATAAR